MKKTILTGAMLALSSFCWGTDIHSDNFKELCNIYAAATRALNEMHSAADWEQTQKVLAELQKKCQNDPSLQAVLQLTYPTCPKELKDSYEGALKEQLEMKDAVKRLSMAGTLQAENISTTMQKHVPEIATIFTTHATTIGRSIAGNNKPLYDYLFAYNGDQMSRELNVESKHSIEKQTAHHVDCFTTVSDITNNECKELLDKEADVVLINGFEDDFVPKGEEFEKKRKYARALLLNLANKLLGTHLGDDTLIVGTSGRYEFKNKGINVYLEALNRLTRKKSLNREVVAFVNVPGWVGDAREDLKQRLESNEDYNTPLECPFITHWLHNMSHDQVLDMLKYLNMSNSPESKVKVIFVPCYLDGNDGILNETYYDLIIGADLSVYPSYYEPWGYTPLESVAFKVPAITTDLAGFGLWVNSLKGHPGTLEDGVKVIHRTDYNYSEVADVIRDTITEFAKLPESEVQIIRKNAADIAEKALWKHFIRYYYEAYDVALRNAKERCKSYKQK